MTKFDISDVLAGLVFKTNPGLTSRLEAQEEELRESACTEPALGRWINDDVEYLLSALSLGDKDFAELFPSMSNVGSDERSRLAAALETHMTRCRHCSLRRGYALELSARIERALRERDGLLSQMLEEDEPDGAQEGEHAGDEQKARRAAGQ